MSSIGGGLAGPQLEGHRRLAHQHAQPVEGGRAPGPGGLQQRRVQRRHHDVGHQLAGSQPPILHAASNVRPCPPRWRSPPARRRPPRPDPPPDRRPRPEPRHRRPASGVRLTTTTSAAPASARPSTSARAAPPAPSTAHRRPATVKPASAASEATKPGPSVLWPTSRSPSATTQLTACNRRAVSRQIAPGRRLQAVGHRRLVRHGHRQPGQGQGAHGVQRRLCPALGHLEGHVHPVEAGGGEGGVEDLGRARMTDRITDHRRHPGGAGGRAASRRSVTPRTDLRPWPWRWPAGSRCSWR